MSVSAVTQSRANGHRPWWTNAVSGLTGWRALVLGLTVLGLIARLILISDTHGGDDLRIYTYFSRLALHGANPFSPVPGGAIPVAMGNSPPLEVGLFSGLLALHDSPTTLRVAFALTDVIILLLIGFAFPRPKPWRAGFLLFYALNPFVLFSWTVFSEDKTLLFLGIVLLMLALERSREWLSWTATALLVVLKFLGAFAAPVLAAHFFRARRWRAVVPAGGFVAACVVSNLLWFPRSLDAFSRRDARLAINPPIHASPTLVLERLGLYSPVEAKFLTGVAILAVFGFFLRRRLDVREAVAWSLFGGYFFLPDDAFNRLLLITLPFMLLLNYSAVRWIVLWGVSCLAALAGVIATRGVPHALSTLAGPLRDVFAHEATLRHVFWMNLLPAVVLGLYVLDRRTRRLVCVDRSHVRRVDGVPSP